MNEDMRNLRNLRNLLAYELVVKSASLRQTKEEVWDQFPSPVRKAFTFDEILTHLTETTEEQAKGVFPMERVAFALLVVSIERREELEETWTTLPTLIKSGFTFEEVEAFWGGKDTTSQKDSEEALLFPIERIASTLQKTAAFHGDSLEKTWVAHMHPLLTERHSFEEVKAHIEKTPVEGV